MMKIGTEKVRFSLRLSEEENEKLIRDSALCGLSQNEFMRQLCLGKTPKILPSNKFWTFLEGLYDLHKAFSRCISFAPDAAEECRKIEDLILRLQEE